MTICFTNKEKNKKCGGNCKKKSGRPKKKLKHCLIKLSFALIVGFEKATLNSFFNKKRTSIEVLFYYAFFFAFIEQPMAFVRAGEGSLPLSKAAIAFSK